MPGSAATGRRDRRGLTAQVPVAGVLDHRTHRHFAQLLAVQAETFDQRAQRTDRYAEVADIRIRGVLAAERTRTPPRMATGRALGMEIPGMDEGSQHGLHGGAGIMERVAAAL